MTGILGVVRFAILVAEFSKSAKEYSSEDQNLLDMVPEDSRERFRSENRKIVRCVAIGLAIPVLILPICVPVALFFVENIKSTDALFRALIMLIFSPVLAFLGIYAGLACGLLVSPRWYLEGPFGDRWRALVGTSSRFGMILVSLMVISVAIASCILISWLTWNAKPFT